MERWRGRVALVTGASVGIGAAIVRALVKHGLKVVGCARNVQQIQVIKEELKGEAGELLPICCDLTQSDQISAMFDQVKSTWGGVDICVNNAGMAIVSTLLDATVDQWRQMLDVNVVALCLCTKLSVQSMRERDVKDGQIIHVNSMSGHRVTAQPNFVFYSATKFAVTALTEGLRSQLSNEESGIRVASVSPGMVETEFAERAFNSKEKAAAIYENTKCLQSDDIAASVIYILSQPQHVQVHDILMRPTDQKF